LLYLDFGGGYAFFRGSAPLQGQFVYFVNLLI